MVEAAGLLSLEGKTAAFHKVDQKKTLIFVWNVGVPNKYRTR